MKRQLIALVVLLAILFVAGGFTAVFQGLDIIWQVFAHIFPIFVPAFKQALEDYLTSAYFIVGVILIVLSSLGIYLSVRAKKTLYLVVSIIVDVISVFSLMTNFASCA